MSQSDLVGAVAVAGALSLGVLGVVGRRSYKRKIVQLTTELEKEGKTIDVSAPPKVWAVLSPQETIKVFTFPLAVVLTGVASAGYVIKGSYGIENMDHAIETIRWIARTGPPPAPRNNM